LILIPDAELNEEEIKEKKKQKLFKAGYDARMRLKAEKLAEKARMVSLKLFPSHTFLKIYRRSRITDAISFQSIPGRAREAGGAGESERSRGLVCEAEGGSRGKFSEFIPTYLLEELS